jgi:hypothetical protein
MPSPTSCEIRISGLTLATAALASFWKLDPADRQKLWATPPINTADALAGFDPQDISDGELGAPQ